LRCEKAFAASILPGDGSSGDGHGPSAILTAAKTAARASVDASPLIVGSRAAFERTIERGRMMLDFLGPGFDGPGRTAADAYLVAAIFARLSGVQWLVRSERAGA
jgi:hypothetical protein